MIREEYLRRLVDEAYVDLYLSGVDGARVYWPWRMQPVHEASKRHRNACEYYIVDSSIQDESITNEDVLDCAELMDAEAAVLADVWHDVDATVEAILDGLEIYDDHAYEGDILVPLQPPHSECYRQLEGQDIDIYAIGGVKDDTDAEKIRAAKDVRAVAGPDVHLHGLGYGATDTIVTAVRNDPTLLDSVDYSTPIQNANVRNVEAGKERMSVVASRAAATLIEDLRRFSPYPNIEEESIQQTLFARADGGTTIPSDTDTDRSGGAS